MPTPYAAVAASHLRFPQMDAVRAIAALTVFGYHLGYVTGANQYASLGVFTSHLNIGVPIFFVISGFLLYRPFVAERAGAPHRSVVAYGRNRVLRIVPAYWVALTLAAIYPGLSGVFTGDWWWYYGFAQVYTPERALLGLPVAWTLAVEVSFYALLPLYALAARRLGRPRVWREVLALALLAALSLWVQQRMVIITIITTFDWFAAGMALALVSVALETRGGLPRWTALVRRHTWAPWAAALALWVFLCTGLGISRDPLVGDPYWVAVVASLLSMAIAALVVLPVVVAGDAPGLTRRILGVGVLAWLGLVSYGLYLYHLPALVAVWKLGLTDVVAGRTALSYAAIALPATIALAALSYYLVERPALRLKTRRRAVRGVPIERVPVAEAPAPEVV